jgi:hypothetical protein
MLAAAVVVSGLVPPQVVKYAYQGVLWHFFADSPRMAIPGMLARDYLVYGGLNTPDSFVANMGCGLAIFGVFAGAGWVCLKYLYKENR